MKNKANLKSMVMYIGNISLYSQYLPLVTGSNVHNVLLLFKTNKKVFYFVFLDQKSSI